MERKIMMPMKKMAMPKIKTVKPKKVTDPLQAAINATKKMPIKKMMLGKM
jgi:hypothetical protein